MSDCERESHRGISRRSLVRSRPAATHRAREAASDSTHDGGRSDTFADGRPVEALRVRGARRRAQPAQCRPMRSKMMRVTAPQDASTYVGTAATPAEGSVNVFSLSRRHRGGRRVPRKHGTARVVRVEGLAKLWLRSGFKIDIRLERWPLREEVASASVRGRRITRHEECRSDAVELHPHDLHLAGAVPPAGVKPRWSAVSRQWGSIWRR